MSQFLNPPGDAGAEEGHHGAPEDDCRHQHEQWDWLFLQHAQGRRMKLWRASWGRCSNHLQSISTSSSCLTTGRILRSLISYRECRVLPRASSKKLECCLRMRVGDTAALKWSITFHRRVQLLKYYYTILIIIVVRAAVHLGCLRQESSSSGRVAVMAEFVELVRARTAAAHTRVLDTRQKLADNNIDMERVLAALESKVAAVMAEFIWTPWYWSQFWSFECTRHNTTKTFISASECHFLIWNCTTTLQRTL